MFPDEATTSLCCWDARNASRKQLLSLGHNGAVRWIVHSPTQVRIESFMFNVPFPPSWPVKAISFVFSVQISTFVSTDPHHLYFLCLRTYYLQYPVPTVSCSANLFICEKGDIGEKDDDKKDKIM
jgi:hypothetical protein